MSSTTGRTLLGLVAIGVAGLVIGVANNVTAGKERRLEWARDYPPKKIRPCSERTEAEDAALTAEQRAIAGAEGEAEVAAATTSSPPVPVGTTLAQASPASAAGSDGATSSAPADPAAATGATATADPAAATGATATAEPAGAPAGPAGPATAPATEPAAAAVTIPDVPPGQTSVELRPEQVKHLFDTGAVFVDARTSALYREGHVRGALSISVWEAGLDEKVAELPFATQGDMNVPIVAYCGGGDCEDSHSLADKVFTSGFTRVYVYKDGFPDWSRRGWPVSTGDAP